MNPLLHLTRDGTLAFAVVALLEWAFAARITARARRLWWLLVPLAFLVVIPTAALPPPVTASLAWLPEGWTAPGWMDAWAGPLPGTLRTAGSPAGHGPPLYVTLLVATGTAAYLLVALLRTRSAVRRWSRERLSTDPQLLGLLEDCKARAGVTAPIGLVVSGSVAAPVLLGWLRPRLLLPAGLTASLSREQLRGVLFHELAHFRSFDVPANWLFTGVCALHWFNPVAHLAFRAWTTFREEAADEAAIGWLGQPSGVAYGETLLHVLRTTHGEPAPYAALAIVESVNQLRKRMLMIKHYENKTPRFLFTGAVLAAVALGLVLRPVRGAEAPDDPKTVASTVMVDWLKEMDDGKYEQSWKDASPDFQKAITSEGWVAKNKEIRASLGHCNQRALASASRQAKLPSPKGEAAGDFILAQFTTSFEGLAYAIETVTFSKTADGTWKPSGYYIKPR